LLRAAFHGLAASALLTLGGSRVLFAGAPPPIAPVAIVLPPAVDPGRAVSDPGREAVETYLAEKYRAARAVIERIVDEAHAAGATHEVDPLLILAVISVESRFDPNARSGFGAKGLMQVVPRFHRDKLAAHGGERSVFDPRVNVAVGTWILKDYVRRSGSLRAGLQRYSGYGDDAEQRYTRKVLAEQRRLLEVQRAAAAGAARAHDGRAGTPNA
jgi:hypothetical protein